LSKPYSALSESFALFFEKAQNGFDSLETTMPKSVEEFRSIFNQPSGVVISTCHGIKGEEFETVIAFALLKGYIPNWRVIIDGTQAQANDRESKLLYVVSSRAKRQLYLISESACMTQSNRPYQTSLLLEDIENDYDY
jgi:superfamily I DNA/RNA helicase